MRKYRSPLKKKLLTCLYAGIALSFTQSGRKTFFILDSLPKELRKLDRRSLYQAIRDFERDRLISYREGRGGIITMVLTERGKQRALIFHIDEMKVKKPAHWDGKWRIVFFDIPEKKRRVRDALRNKLSDLGFKELQHSVHIFPYPCKDEIDFIVEFFEARRWVYFLETETFSNEARWIVYFKLQ